MTHHPEDTTPANGVAFLSCDPAEAVRIGLAAAHGKNLEVFSPTIGLRLYDNPGSEPIRLHVVGAEAPAAALNVRYRPATTARIPA